MTIRGKRVLALAGVLGLALVLSGCHRHYGLYGHGYKYHGGHHGHYGHHHKHKHKHHKKHHNHY